MTCYRGRSQPGDFGLSHSDTLPGGGAASFTEFHPNRHIRTISVKSTFPHVPGMTMAKLIGQLKLAEGEEPHDMA